MNLFVEKVNRNSSVIVFHFQWIKELFESFLRRFSYNSLNPYLIRFFSKAEDKATLRTEQLHTKKTVKSFLYQNTNVWFLCKTNLS